MSAFLNAIRAGFSSNTVLNHVKTKWPQYANAINTAQVTGYTANNILHYLAKDKKNDPDEYLTEHEKVLKRDKQQKRAAAVGLVSAAGTAGAIAAGTYSAATRNQAIQPSAILPAQRQQLPPGAPGATINVTPRPRGGPQGGFPAPRQGLPAPRQGLPAPTPSVQQAPEDLFPQSPQLQNLEHKRAAIGQMFDLASRGKTGGNPFLKTTNKLIKDGTITDVANFTNFYNWWNATEGQKRGGPLVEYEKFRVQTKGMFQPPEEIQQNAPPSSLEGQNQEEVQVRDLQQNQPMEIPGEKPEEKQEYAPPIIPQMSVKEQTRQAAFGDRPELKKLVDHSLKGREFSIPFYKMAGESSESFKTRKLIDSGIKKAAVAISEGKNFLDFMERKEEGENVSYHLPEGVKGKLSIAEDVLRFLGGIPNVYDPLLDEEEKQELYDMLMESGEKTVEGLRPSEGERNIHGAMMSPNQVWNLILMVEPKLAAVKEIAPIKGRRKPTPFNVSNAGRFLTHAVHGVLSGNSLSSQLADKIERISSIASNLDSMAKAAEDGNFRKVLSEIERLSEDDEAFFSLFDDTVEEMVAQYGIKGMYSKGSAADTKSANEIRKKLGNKEEIPKGEHGD